MPWTKVRISIGKHNKGVKGKFAKCNKFQSQRDYRKVKRRKWRNPQRQHRSLKQPIQIDGLGKRLIFERVKHAWSIDKLMNEVNKAEEDNYLTMWRDIHSSSNIVHIHSLINKYRMKTRKALSSAATAAQQRSIKIAVISQNAIEKELQYLNM